LTLPATGSAVTAAAPFATGIVIVYNFPPDADQGMMGLPKLPPN